MSTFFNPLVRTFPMNLFLPYGGEAIRRLLPDVRRRAMLMAWPRPSQSS
jgi:hypothetical protein